MAEIKWHKANSLPSNPTSLDDGIWFVKADADDKFQTYVIDAGIVVPEPYQEALEGKADYIGIAADLNGLDNNYAIGRIINSTLHHPTGTSHEGVFITSFGGVTGVQWAMINSLGLYTRTNTGLTDADYTPWVRVADRSWVQSQNYLTTETDPTVPSHVKAITTGEISNWNAAEANVNPDWAAVGGDPEVLNKPTFTVGNGLEINNNTSSPLNSGVNNLNIDFNYLDNRYTSGFKQKEAVIATTTGNITLSGLQTVDGVSLIAGDRVLVKNQTNAPENGIYAVSSTAWTRTTDFDSVGTGEVEQGASIFVEEGTTQAKTGWTLATGGTIVLGTTNLNFIQYAGNTSYSGGDRIVINGNVINHDSGAWAAKPALTGGNVISNLTFDGFGHPTDWTTRNLDDRYLQSVNWGDIGGALSNQTDLNTVLDNKLNARYPYISDADVPNDTQEFANVSSTTTNGFGAFGSIISSMGTVGFIQFGMARGTGLYERVNKGTWDRLATQPWVQGQNYLTNADINGYATEAWTTANFDNYQSWNLKTNGVQRTTVQSGGTLDLVAGTNTSLQYSAGGVVTINSSFNDTTYTAGTGLNLNGTEFSFDTAFGDNRYLQNVSWGDIIGTLSNQADLQNALNEKVDYKGVASDLNGLDDNTAFYDITGGTLHHPVGTTNAGVALTSFGGVTGTQFALINNIGLFYRTNTGLSDADYSAWEQIASQSWVNAQNYLTSETDPTVPSHVKNITTGDISDWNTAFGWGDFRDYGLGSKNEVSNLNTITKNNSLSNAGLSTTGAPTSGVSTTLTLYSLDNASTLGGQLSLDYSTINGNYQQADLYIRAKSSATTWFPWLRVATTDDIPTNNNQLTNGAGYITGVNWGDIGGTLSNQTDLQSALDGKADNATTLGGYGITNAYTQTQVDNLLGDYYTETESDNRYMTVLNQNVTSEVLTTGDDLNTIISSSNLAYDLNVLNSPTTAGGQVISGFRAANTGIQIAGGVTQEDEFFYRFVLSSTPHPWFQIASREWVNSQITTVNNNTITLATSGIATGGGNFNLNQGSNETINIDLPGFGTTAGTVAEGNHTHTLGDLSNVVDTVDTASQSDILMYNGINWDAVSISTAVTTPTLQQVITAGSTLTGDNTINSNGDIIFNSNDGGSSFLNIKGSTGFSIGTTTDITLFATNDIYVQSNGGDAASLSTANLTATRTYDFPNKGGTIALLDDIPTPVDIRPRSEYTIHYLDNQTNTTLNNATHNIVFVTNRDATCPLNPGTIYISSADLKIGDTIEIKNDTSVGSTGCSADLGFEYVVGYDATNDTLNTVSANSPITGDLKLVYVSIDDGSGIPITTWIKIN